MLEIAAAGFTFPARLEEEAAPLTVARFRTMLPFEERIIHARWSGESAWIPWGDLDLGDRPGERDVLPRARASCCSTRAA